MSLHTQLGIAEEISGTWSALHSGVQLFVREDEVHYLTAMALSIDDDLASLLLIKKLKVAEVVEAEKLPQGTVVLNSFVEYAIDGKPRPLRQLTYASYAMPSSGLSATSLEGVGVIGLRAGQTILWPDDRGNLRDLHVLAVDNIGGYKAVPGTVTARA